MIKTLLFENRCDKSRFEASWEDLNRSEREGRIESIHSIKSLERMELSSHDLGAELRMHPFTVLCDTFQMKKKLQQLSQ